MLGLTFVQEFSIEIPDKEADSILSSMFAQWKVGWYGHSIANPLAVDKAVNYILGQPDGKFLEKV